MRRLYRRGVMSARMRILVVIGVAAVAAIGAVAFISGRGSDGIRARARRAARKGAPPLALDLGLRDRRAGEEPSGGRSTCTRPTSRGGRPDLRPVSSLAAQIGSAFAGWPNGTVSQLEGMANRYPDNSLVLLNLGLAPLLERRQRGRGPGLADAYGGAARHASSLTADRLLHPNNTGRHPVFVPALPRPSSTGSPRRSSWRARRRGTQAGRPRAARVRHRASSASAARSRPSAPTRRRRGWRPTTRSRSSQRR